MRSILIAILALSVASCNGNSDETVETLSTPFNFSESKYNEDLVGKFAVPEMKKVVSALETIVQKTKNCEDKAVDLDIKLDWREAALSYQLLRPLEASLLDRDLETSSLLSERYLGGAYSVNTCRLQLNTAEQNLNEKTLKDDPALNSLELLIFEDLTKRNFCNGETALTIKAWMGSEAKNEDVCKQINFIAKTAAKQLSAINAKNEELYKDGESNQIFAANNLQDIYDRLSVFADQILKDKVIGEPLGLSGACPFEGRTCPKSVEHGYSKITFEAISKNLEGVMMVFNQKKSMDQKPQSKGLYQFLLANRKDNVADAFYDNLLEAHKLSTGLHGQDLMEIAAALDGAANKEKCINTSLQNRKIPACALFRSIKDLSDKIKMDLRLALAVSSTKQIEGDSD